MSGYISPRHAPSAVECRTCGIAHDDAVHAAVLSVRSWLRSRLALAMRPVKKVKAYVAPGPRFTPASLALSSPEMRRAASRKGGIGNRGRGRRATRLPTR